jgi:diaminohydroxyphosphoribosylaminopyrimidine deaminase / 5-amino-6-(5-phosphoribosylamino)uracil reductase
VTSTPVSPAEARAMVRARELAARVRRHAPPNPWVGCVLLSPEGEVIGEGATAPPGGPHAEAAALAAAEDRARGATAVVTLEPCCHQGRTPPCTAALIEAGVKRVIAAVTDPDARVAGGGVEALRAAGIDVVVGHGGDEATAQLLPYLHQRQTGRPYVMVKLAATLDGRIAAPDGSSRWITGAEARADVHQLRAESDAVVVGAGTARADDPELTVREVEGEDPLRVVLGQLPEGARMGPALELSGPPAEVVAELGKRGALQVLVEGGARVAGDFHRAGCVDRYVIYLAPALMGGADGLPLMGGPGAGTMADIWRGRFLSHTRLGEDLRVDLVPLQETSG